MKVTAFLRAKSVAKNNVTDQATIYFRVRSEGVDLKAASELTINPNHWSQDRQGYKNRIALISEEERNRLNDAVRELTSLIAREYYIGADSKWLQRVIFVYHHPNAFKLHDHSIVEAKVVAWVKKYMEQRVTDKHQASNYRGLIDKLERFEKFQRRINHKQGYSLCLDTITCEDLTDFKDYLVKEHKYAVLHPELFEGIKRKRAYAKPRSENTMRTVMSALRTVINYAIHNGATTNDPFTRYDMPTTMYGTPFFLTLEERDKLLELDLSDDPTLASYRDMFIFQCMVGCRHGDLVRFTPENIHDGVLEYIPHKTREKSARTVRVPLGEKAQTVLSRLDKEEGKPLFSLRFNFKYNDAIRDILKRAEIDRLVTVIDPVSREEVRRPLYEVGTSHMARRTFIGNLYNKVKDPNLISSMSGHVNGSRAFARYRAIDDDMKRELVNLIS